MGRPPKATSQLSNRPEWARRLVALRTLTGNNQEWVAQRIGTSQQRYGQWEVGKYEPSIEMLIRLADLFGVSVDYLLRGEKPDSHKN